MFSTAYRHWIGSFQGFSRQIWLLSLVSLINRIGAMVVPFLTLYLTQKLGFSLKESGYILAFFGVGALVGAYLGGRLTDSIGYFKVQVVSLLLNGIMLMLMPLLHTFIEMVLAVLLMSFTSEIFRPANSVAFLLNSTPENRTRAIALYRLALNLGFSVAPALGGLLIAFGWHFIFWVDGITCLLASVILVIFMHEEPKTNTVLMKEQQKQLNAADLPYRNKHYLLFVLFTFLNALVFLQFVWTLPAFYKQEYLWTESQIGTFMSINGLIIVFLEMPIIAKLEKKYNSLIFIRIGVLLYAASYLIYLLPLPAVIAVACSMILISFGEMGVMPFSSSMVMNQFGANKQGQYMAFYTMAYSVANIIAPLMGTYIADSYGFHTLWWVLAGIVAFAYFVLAKFEQKGQTLEASKA